MSFLTSIFSPSEARSLENPSVSLDDPRAVLTVFGGQPSFSGESVTEATALGVPAIKAAVEVISGSIAALPLKLFKRGPEGRQTADADPLYRIVHDVVNADYLTSFAWRKYLISRLLLRGRAFTFIERNGAGKVMNLWPLDPDRMTVEVKGWKRVYRYRDAQGEKVFAAGEIIDLIWLPASNPHEHLDPLAVNRHAIGLAIAAERYASSVFENGGVPPFALETTASSPKAQERALDQTEAKLRQGRKGGEKAIAIAPGDKLTTLGGSPVENQCLELRAFQILEVARIFNIPPTLIQDHSRSTFSNTEQLDLAFVKHTLAPLIELIEQELNAKLFSDRNRSNYVEFSLDGLLRGDSNRIKNYAAGVNAGLYTPDELRARENLPPVAGGDRAYRQGALVPLDSDGFTGGQSIPPERDEPSADLAA